MSLVSLVVASVGRSGGGWGVGWVLLVEDIVLGTYHSFCCYFINSMVLVLVWLVVLCLLIYDLLEESCILDFVGLFRS